MNWRIAHVVLALLTLCEVCSRVEGGLKCQQYDFARQLCQAGIDSNIATVAARHQQYSQWCWAACIQMVFAYYGHEVSQERIVAETWGAIANMPGQPLDILRDLNRVWQDDSGRSFQVAGDVFSANATTAAQDLGADHPLIIGTGGHAVVLTAETFIRDMFGNGSVQAATIRDPWPGQGKRAVTPQEWNGISFAVRIRVTELGSTSLRGSRSASMRLTPSATPEERTDFCSALRQLAAGIENDFQVLRGITKESQPGRQKWESIVRLPAAENCEITSWHNTSWDCRCVMTITRDRSEAERIYRSTLTKVRSCLSHDWHESNADTDSGTTGRAFSKLSQPADLNVEITLEKTTNFNHVVVRFAREGS